MKTYVFAFVWWLLIVVGGSNLIAQNSNSSIDITEMYNKFEFEVAEGEEVTRHYFVFDTFPDVHYFTGETSTTRTVRFEEREWVNYPEDPPGTPPTMASWSLLSETTGAYGEDQTYDCLSNAYRFSKVPPQGVRIRAMVTHPFPGGQNSASGWVDDYSHLQEDDD